MKKKVVSLALALVMAIALMPSAARATEYTVTEVAGEYSEVRDFCEGYAAVRNRDRKWGFVDTSGKEVVPCKYDDIGGYWASGFSEGLAWVELDEKCGYIDVTGKEVIPCKYDDAGRISEGLVKVRVGDYSTGKCGFVNSAGKEVVPCKYDSAYDFSGGLAAVRLDGKWGYIDITGKEVIPCKYDNVGSFSEGLAAVCLDEKWGYIDTTGKEVIPCKYDGYEGVHDFSEGFAWVANTESTVIDGCTYTENKYGLIDKTGREVVPHIYDGAENFQQGFARVGISIGDEKVFGREYYTLIDKTGKEIIPIDQCLDIFEFREGLAAVCFVDGGYGFIDKTGKVVIPANYYEAGSFSGGYAVVSLLYVSDEDPVEKWGIIDKTGKEIVPCKYFKIYNFSEGFAAVSVGSSYRDEKWGFIDSTGREVIPCQYKNVNSFSEGIAWVQSENGKWSLISVSGNTAPTPLTAIPTNDALKVDGVSKVPTAYKIGGANYFQLRDVAMMLNGTKAQFSVDYDKQRKAVVITTGQAYAPLGTELSGAAQGNAEAIIGNNDIYINGEKVDFEVYKIGGANFFQIRALGQTLGFNVGWTKSTGMFIESDKAYDPNN